MLKLKAESPENTAEIEQCKKQIETAKKYEGKVEDIKITDKDIALSQSTKTAMKITSRKIKNIDNKIDSLEKKSTLAQEQINSAMTHLDRNNNEEEQLSILRDFNRNINNMRYKGEKSLSATLNFFCNCGSAIYNWMIGHKTPEAISPTSGRSDVYSSKKPGSEVADSATVKGYEQLSRQEQQPPNSLSNN